MGFFAGESVRSRRIVVVLAALVIVIGAVVVGARLLMNSAAGQRSSAPLSDRSAHDSAHSTTVATASRGPADFPDMEHFTDVSATHNASAPYSLATFTSPTGLQCAMWSTRGSTAASCVGPIPGLDHEAHHAYVDDYGSSFDDRSPPADEHGVGKPLNSGEKIVLGAGGQLMGGDELTCGVDGSDVMCRLIRNFPAHRGEDRTQWRGFVISPQGSWAF